MKKFSLFILVSILLFSNLFFLVKLNKVEKEKGECEKTAIDGQFYMNINYKLLEDFGIHYSNEDIEINSNVFLENEKGVKIKLSELCKNKAILVLRYSELNCQECVNKQVQALKDVAKEIGYDNILLIASYTSRRDLLLFKRINQIPFTVYRIPEEGLGIEIDKLSTPYYFVLNHKNTISLVFMPTKEFESLQEMYLTTIKKRFF